MERIVLEVEGGFRLVADLQRRQPDDGSAPNAASGELMKAQDSSGP